MGLRGGGSPAEFWTGHGGREWTGALKVASGLTRHLRSRCQIQKRHSSSSMDDRPSLSARDYVESLHQNSRATLLYGKNNVLVQPVRGPISGPGLPLRVWLQVTEEGSPWGPRLLIHLSIHPLTDLPVHSSANISISPSVHPQGGMSFHSITHPFICQYPTQLAGNSLPASVFTHPSVHASVDHFLAICLYLYPPSHLSIHPSIYPPLRPCVNPSILLPVINSTHQSSIHPSLTSICPSVHLFSSPSTHCLSTPLSYLSSSLVITHSLSSLICAEPALHGVLRISRGTSSQPVFMECRYWCVCRKEAAFLCTQPLFQSDHSLSSFRRHFKKPP